MADTSHIVFIVIDTLRRDHASILEKILGKLGFISYDNAIAPSPWTTPSHASIFTGLYPILHGAHETRDKKLTQVKLSKRLNLINCILKNEGYTTYLLTANILVCPQQGYIGFDRYYCISNIRLLNILNSHERDKLRKILNLSQKCSKLSLIKYLLSNHEFKLLGKLVLDKAFNNMYSYALVRKWPKDKGSTRLIKVLSKWLYEDDRSTPKFIFINFMEVHDPYSIKENVYDILYNNLLRNRLDQGIVSRWRKKYPKHVKYIGDKLIDLMNVLKKYNMYDNSLIIITSDHGQLLGEHDRIGHGVFLYDELLRVPLLIKYPKGYKIEHFSPRSKYISLVRLKQYIIDLIDNKIDEDITLYSDTVFAESYGIHMEFPLKTQLEKKNAEKLEKYRIAIYLNGAKSIFNVSEWRFEYIILNRSKEGLGEEEALKKMKKELIRFINSAVKLKSIKLRKNTLY